MPHITGDWKEDEPITIEILNGYDTAQSKANVSIPNTEFTRAPAVALTTGTATALIATISDFTLRDMNICNLKLHVDIGANPTLNINGTGAKAIYTSDGKPVAAATIKTNSIIVVIYNSTVDRYYAIGTSIQLSNATNSTATDIAASSKAVKDTYDLANTANSTANAANTLAGTANSAASTAQSTANSAQSTANAAQTKANNAVQKTGDTMTGQLKCDNGLIVTNSQLSCQYDIQVGSGGYALTSIMGKAQGAKTSSQSIGANSTTKITFDYEKFDQQNEFNNSAGIYLPNMPGRYMINANIRTSGSGSGQAYLQVYVNGNPDDYLFDGAFTAGDSLTGVSVIDLTGGESIDIRINTSIACNVASGSRGTFTRLN